MQSFLASEVDVCQQHAGGCEAPRCLDGAALVAQVSVCCMSPPVEWHMLLPRSSPPTVPCCVHKAFPDFQLFASFIFTALLWPCTQDMHSQC